MDYKKIKRGQMLYLVMENCTYSGNPNAIVPVKVIRRECGGLFNFVVEQDIEGFKHRLTVSDKWLTVLKPQAALDLAFNQVQIYHRIHANGWRFSLNHKTAKDEILKRIITLPKSQQKAFWKRIKDDAPQLLKTERAFMVSKIKMETWREITWLLLLLEFPYRDMEIHEA